MKTKATDLVHEYQDKWVVAAWSDRNAQYSVPMTAEARRVTGCSGVFARTLKGIATDPCAPGPYRTRATALKAARRIYGDLLRFSD